MCRVHLSQMLLDTPLLPPVLGAISVDALVEIAVLPRKLWQTQRNPSSLQLRCRKFFEELPWSHRALKRLWVLAKFRQRVTFEQVILITLRWHQLLLETDNEYSWPTLGCERSEERRVGKECRSR